MPQNRGSDEFESSSSLHNKHGSTFGTWTSVARVLGADLRLFIERAIICDLSILSHFSCRVKKLEQKNAQLVTHPQIPK